MIGADVCNRLTFNKDDRIDSLVKIYNDYLSNKYEIIIPTGNKKWKTVYINSFELISVVNRISLEGYLQNKIEDIINEVHYYLWKEFQLYDDALNIIQRANNDIVDKIKKIIYYELYDEILKSMVIAEVYDCQNKELSKYTSKIFIEFIKKKNYEEKYLCFSYSL